MVANIRYILSLIRGAIKARMKNSIHLYLGARTARDVYGKGWLQALGDEHGDHEVGTQRRGLDTDPIAFDWSSLKDCRVYLCGPTPMGEATSLLVQSNGVNSAQIYSDAFYLGAT